MFVGRILPQGQQPKKTGSHRSLEAENRQR